MPTRPVRVLVAVEASQASDQALEYAGAVLAGVPGVQVHPVHVVGPLPPDLRSGPGERVSDERRNAQAVWMTAARDEAKGVLERAAQRLRGAGIDAAAISPRVAELPSGTDVAACILEAARDLECDTIVVGREAISWVPSLLHPHVAERVARRATHAAVWIVG
jgi:nucleotide-binding universal stress UspA family protein